LNLLSTLGGVLAGLFGRELWEWLPTVTRALIQVVTWPLSPERREIRRNEWGAELEHFKQRRILALLWVLSLLPVCLWEAATERGVFGRFGSFGERYLLLYVVYGSCFIPTALEMASRWGLSTSETVVFMVFAPIAIGCAFVVGVFVFPVIPALAVLLILDWAEARSRLADD